MKTRKQLTTSASISILMAIGVSGIPITMYMDYKQYGFIYTGKSRVFTATGGEALTIICGIAAAAFCLAIMAGYHCLLSVIKIKRGEFAGQDETPEFVICTDCGEPQRSEDLQGGYCRKCTGKVEDVKGYYDRHPERLSQSQTIGCTHHPQAGIAEFKTCTKCGKTYYKEECPDTTCMDCRTT